MTIRQKTMMVFCRVMPIADCIGERCLRVLRILRGLVEWVGKRLRWLGWRRGAVLGTACCLCTLWIIQHIKPATTFVWEENQRVLLARLMKMCGVTPAKQSEVLREALMLADIKPNAPGKDHTHAIAAAQRRQAIAMAEQVATASGSEVYYYQMSRSDQRFGREGSRSYWWAKDLTAAPSWFCPNEQSIIGMIDVDYYVDMPRMMSTLVRPYVLYTLIPEDVACAESPDNFTFTFDSASRIDYCVDGGGRYKHHLWDYNSDVVVTQSRDWFGRAHVAAYAVEKRRITKHRYLVLLAPIVSWHGWWANVAAFLSGKVLDRLDVVHGRYLRMKIQEDGVMYTSTGVVGEHAVARVRADVEAALVQQNAEHKLMLATVKTHLKDYEVGVTSAILHSYITAAGSSTVPRVAYVAKSGVRRYQFPPFDQEAKPSMVAFMEPFIDEAYCPDRSRGNETRAVAMRVTSIADNDTVLTEKTYSIMMDFIRELIPRGTVLIPQEDVDVYAKQNRPAQRRVLDFGASVAGNLKRVVKSFLKAEAYAKIQDPRIISTINAVDKLRYSRYTMALAQHVKRFGWYAFGKTPREIANRVVRVCHGADCVIQTDFSRFDGRVSYALRCLERFILLRAFPYHTNEIQQLHRAQFSMYATLPLRTRYRTEFARCSGSPETSLFNSIANAFIAYYALRNERECGASLTHAEAWGRLGIYGGDDGLTANVQRESYSVAAKHLGQQLTAEITRPGVAVVFLARWYVSPWTGIPDSHCDVVRQLRKFHVTPSSVAHVADSVKFTEKLSGYYFTDPNTFVFQQLLAAAQRLGLLTTTVSEFSRDLRSWASMTTPDQHYPNNVGQLGYENVVQELHRIGFDIGKFEQWVKTVNTVDDLLRPPRFVVRALPVLELGVALDGDILPVLATPAPIMSETGTTVETVNVSTPVHNGVRKCESPATTRSEPPAGTGGPVTMSHRARRTTAWRLGAGGRATGGRGRGPHGRGSARSATLDSGVPSLPRPVVAQRPDSASDGRVSKESALAGTFFDR